ncbi:hypothetical protein [Ensifer adhaerens]|uniref:hypothetical protein n=1 Tax=Ensifer adhaerens TaxID=106592 RepID=UPI001177E55A|nr:hypothetical protein [Ensifer adhaerens]
MKYPTYGLILASMLTACTAVNRIPEEHRMDKHYGEASYFMSRCPQYKSLELKGAVFAYCLANKAYNTGCNPKQMANAFLDGALASEKTTKARYENVPTEKVCSVAEARYGKNGSVFKQLMIR